MKKIAVAFMLIALLPVAGLARPFRTVKLKTAISSVDFLLGLKHFARIGVRGEIHIRDLQSGQLKHTLKSHIRPPQSLAFSPAGKLLASAGTDGVRVWNARTGQLIHNLHSGMDNFSLVTFSPDGRTVAAVGIEDPVCFWDVRSGKLKAERDPVFTSAFSFSPDGKTYVVADYGGTRNRKRDMRVAEVETGKIISTLRYSDDIDTATFSPDGKWVISVDSAGSGFAQVGVWDVKAKKLKRVLRWKGKSVHSAALAPNNFTLATASDQIIRLWNLKSGKLTGTLSHETDVVNLIFSANGKVLSSVTRDGTINRWRVK